MEPAVLGLVLDGLVLDSSVLIAAERKKLTTPEAIRKVREAAGEAAIVICSLTVAELAHGIYRADTPERSKPRRGSRFHWPISSLELARWSWATRSEPPTSAILSAFPA